MFAGLFEDFVAAVAAVVTIVAEFVLIEMFYDSFTEIAKITR